MTHKLIHSDLKPHVCHIGECRSKFRKSSALQSDKLQVHYKIRPHECTAPGCGATFGRVEHLRDHEHTHMGSRPFSCTHDGCGSSFAQHAHLVTHTQSLTLANYLISAPPRTVMPLLSQAVIARITTTTTIRMRASSIASGKKNGAPRS